MKKTLSTLVISSILFGSFTAFAADKSVSEIMAANMDAKLSATDLARKTVLDLQANHVSSEALNDYLENELSASQIRKFQQAQEKGITPEVMSNLMENIGQGAQFTSLSKLACNQSDVRQYIMIGGAIVALVAYSSANCDTNPQRCPQKVYNNETDYRLYQLERDQLTRDGVDQFNQDLWNPEPSYHYEYGAQDLQAAKTEKLVGAVSLGVAAVTSLSCLVK